MEWTRKEQENRKLADERKKRRGGINLDKMPAPKSYASPSEKKFGFISRLKVKKDNTFGKVKYVAAKWNAMSRETASETFKAESDKELGTSKTSSGIGKRRIKAGDVRNPSIDNLHTNSDEYYNPVNDRLLHDPRMLARQVASWRLARTLNIRVLSREKYALHTLESGEEELVAISAKVSGESLQSIQEGYRTIMSGSTESVREKEIRLGRQIFSGKIQKELSDLQLMDALTGQTDRHSGNIYIDLEAETVRGIDNDQAFGYENSQLNYHNALSSFTLPQKGSNNPIEYNQSQIDHHTAEKILALTEDDLEGILTDKVGTSYGEYLTEKEIAAAKERLAAIQRQIRKLKAEKKLIKTWDDTTYQAALNEELKPIDFVSSQQEPGFKSHKYGNYVARSVRRIIG